MLDLIRRDASFFPGWVLSWEMGGLAVCLTKCYWKEVRHSLRKVWLYAWGKDANLFCQAGNKVQGHFFWPQPNTFQAQGKMPEIEDLIPVTLHFYTGLHCILTCFRAPSIFITFMNTTAAQLKITERCCYCLTNGRFFSSHYWRMQRYLHSADLYPIQ